MVIVTKFEILMLDLYASPWSPLRPRHTTVGRSVRIQSSATSSRTPLFGSLRAGDSPFAVSGLPIPENNLIIGNPLVEINDNYKIFAILL